VLTVGGIGEKAPIAYDKIQTFTLVRRGDRWLCAAFQNTAMSDRAKTAFNQRPNERSGAYGHLDGSLTFLLLEVTSSTAPALCCHSSRDAALGRVGGVAGLLEWPNSYE